MGIPSSVSPEFSLCCSQLFQQSESRASFCLLLDREGEKEALAESRQAFEVIIAQTSELVNLIFSRQTVFFSHEHSCINITMIITEPAVPDTRLLGFCILATCSASSTKFLLDFIVDPRPLFFNRLLTTQNIQEIVK